MGGWTTEPPSEAGWYWARRYPQQREPYTERVWEAARGMLYVGNTRLDRFRVLYPDCLWDPVPIVPRLGTDAR